MNAAFQKATQNRNYTKKIELMRTMMAEMVDADDRGDLDLCSLLQASVTAMAGTVARDFGRGFYEVMADVEGQN